MNISQMRPWRHCPTGSCAGWLLMLRRGPNPAADACIGERRDTGSGPFLTSAAGSARFANRNQKLPMKTSVKWPLACMALLLLAACTGNDPGTAQPIPADIVQILDKPLYRNAVWSMQVVDLDTGEVIHDKNPGQPFLIGSVRKLFSVGVLLDALGPDHTFRTPVYRRGFVDAAGELKGDLILVASGDLAMGGRTHADGSFAVTDADHNESNALGSASITATDPLAGYDALARQVAAAGVRRVSGEVIIDDRLFTPFNFRGEFDVSPIFVNDNVVDVIMRPTRAGVPADTDWRPKSAAFSVRSTLMTTAAGTGAAPDLVPELPACIGLAGCSGDVGGTLAVDFVPAITGRLPLVRTFRIVQPSNYARTVFVEALIRAGVSVAAPAVSANPAALLPARISYSRDTRVAELVSHPYRDVARLILKVSYNLGADLSTMLYGVSKDATTFPAALAAELNQIAAAFHVPLDELHFVDGSGGGETRATSHAVIRLLDGMSRRPVFADFYNALPSLGVDGSLAMVTGFAADPMLAGAKGKVHAKTGTFVSGTEAGAVLKAQALAGYIDTKSGRRLAFTLAVNDVGVISDISDVLEVFQDQGTIAAYLWQLL